MLLIISLFLSIPPVDPPATMIRTATVEFVKLDQKEVERMAGEQVTPYWRSAS